MLSALIVTISAALTFASAPGWQVGDLDGGLERAKRGKIPWVLVKVSADWCGPCNQLNHEVFETPRGAALLADAVGVVVDFEAAEGQRVKKRYTILGLPTTLVLDPQGVEVGRVEGYGDADEYIGALKEAKAGAVGLDALVRAAAADPHSRDARITLAQARLVRGQVEDARAVFLDEAKAGGPDGARAARVWGRYLLRVNDDAAGAALWFAKMVETYKNTKSAAGFLYWQAKALKAGGEMTSALALFDAWAKAAPADPRPMLYKADFMVLAGADPKATEAVIALARLKHPKEPELDYMLAQVFERQGRHEEARAAAERAVKAAPETALYVNLRARLAARAKGR